MEILARIAAATKSYGPVIALDGVSLDVPAGQLLGLLGPNGAGKTTLLQLLAGLRRPTCGTVELFAGDPRKPSRRRRLGCTPQETGLPPTLRVHEVVDFVAGHFDHPVPTAQLLEQFGLSGLGRRQSGGLSGGQKRRLVVAIAFLAAPIWSCSTSRQLAWSWSSTRARYAPTARSPTCAPWCPLAGCGCGPQTCPS